MCRTYTCCLSAVSGPSVDHDGSKIGESAVMKDVCHRQSSDIVDIREHVGVDDDGFADG